MLNGNPVTPNRSLIAFRKSYGEHSVLVGIDGYYLKNVLELLKSPTEIHLLVGTSWMDSSGHVSNDKFKPHGTSYFQTSKHFLIQWQQKFLIPRIGSMCGNTRQVVLFYSLCWLFY